MSIEGTEVLVVGGAGFVGSNLANHLLENGALRVVVVDNLLSSEPDNLPVDNRIQFVEGSITDDSVLQQIPKQLDYVWHLACYHGNQSSIHDPFADHENNTLTSLKLFDHLKGMGSLKKVVYAAAGCAVAEKTFADAEATTEDAPVSLYHDSPYSISKVIGEMYANYYWTRYALPVVKTRFQNVYGPGEVLGAGRWRGTPHTVWRNVTPTFVWKALQGEALPLENAGQGSRDFIYVGDMVRGLTLAAVNGSAGEVYNLASGRETTIAELAEVINRLTGNVTPPDIQPARTWDTSGKRFGSTVKSRESLAFSAEVDLDTGLAKTVAWTKANSERIQRCMDKHVPYLHSAAGAS